MAQLTTEVERLTLVIEIGGMPIRIHTTEPEFVTLLQSRYAGFVTTSEHPEIDFEIELKQPGFNGGDKPVEVHFRRGRWSLERADFIAEWEPASRHGWIRQTLNPHSLDCIFRIVHSLVLACEGGFLLHSASVIRNGRAFLFAGVSGAGKTTISRLAPPDATLLTDEISYVRKQKDRYVAYGTPFTGELAKLGENVSAPVAALYLLAQGKENRIDAISPADAARSLLANTLFFAEDEQLVRAVFESVFDLVSRVPVSRLTFVPDARVWELIR